MLNLDTIEINGQERIISILLCHFKLSEIFAQWIRKQQDNQLNEIKN